MFPGSVWHVGVHECMWHFGIWLYCQLVQQTEYNDKLSAPVVDSSVGEQCSVDFKVTELSQLLQRKWKL